MHIAVPYIRLISLFLLTQYPIPHTNIDGTIEYSIDSLLNTNDDSKTMESIEYRWMRCLLDGNNR